MTGVYTDEIQVIGPSLAAPGGSVMRASYRVAVAAAAISVYASAGIAGDPPADEWQPPAEVQLSDRDLEEIRTVMIGHAPMLASSPGVKFASAHEAHRGSSKIVVNVVFHPFADEGGMARALSANCERTGVDEPWICRSGRSRAYLRVPGQGFRPVLLVEIDYESALALIEATRDALRTDPVYGADPPAAAMMWASGWRLRITSAVRITRSV